MLFWLFDLIVFLPFVDKIVAVEKADDTEEDPEYNALEDEDVPDELDMRFDNTVKVTSMALNFTELLSLLFIEN